ncbi:MAG: hypothetical protein VKO21_04300, partial [Candidatus Sericytochromatia bacterium]|nr:hypothetical protein [Candidatus Sericytochromatia bacterium]
AVACAGNSQGRVLGRQVRDVPGGGSEEGPLDEFWASRVLDGPKGLGTLVGTRGAVLSVPLPGDMNRRSRWLVRSMTADAFGAGRTLSFSNLPVPDGAGSHAYILVAAAWSRGRLLGYREQGIADSVLVAGGNSLLPSLTVTLDEGLSGPATWEVTTGVLPAARLIPRPRITTWVGDAGTAPAAAMPELDAPLGELTALHMLADGQLAAGTAAPGKVWILGSTATQLSFDAATLLGDKQAFIGALFDWPGASFGLACADGNSSSPLIPYQVLNSGGYGAYALDENISPELRARVSIPGGGVAWVYPRHVVLEDPTEGTMTLGDPSVPGDVDDSPGTSGEARFRDLRGAVALSGQELLVAEPDRLRVIQLVASEDLGQIGASAYRTMADLSLCPECGGEVARVRGEVSSYGNRSAAGLAHAPVDIRGLAVTREGWVAVSDAGKGTVLRLDPSTRLLQPWAGTPRSPAAAPPLPVDGFFPEATLHRPGPLVAAPGGGVFLADGETVRWLR